MHSQPTDSYWQLASNKARAA